MSTNIDNSLHKSNDTSTGVSLKSALGFGSDKASTSSASINKAATTSYLNSLSYEQDNVGENLSRSMNKLNQSLSQAASSLHEGVVDEQAEKMAVYSKLASKIIERDSSLQEKVAQDLSKNSSIVRNKEASESLQKAMDNLPSKLKEGTQAGKDLAKFMVENLVTLSDHRQMGAGLERDLAVRQINIPKKDPTSRQQNASAKVLSASIEYVKNNQPEVLAKITTQEAKTPTPSSNLETQEGFSSSKPLEQDSTYLSALKAQRNNNHSAESAIVPQDKISAEISKRIHNLIAQAANNAKSGNLINLSPEEAERFDRSITTQNKTNVDVLERIFSKNSSTNAADGELPPPSNQGNEAKVRQLSLSELSARASKLQSKFRQERMRIVQEGKLPDPAQMPEMKFDKAAVKSRTGSNQNNQAQRAAQTLSLQESLARARSAFIAHNITSEQANNEDQAPAPQPNNTESKPAQQQPVEQKPVAQAETKPASIESKPTQQQPIEQKPVAQVETKPASIESKPAQQQPIEQKPVAQVETKPASIESKPAQQQPVEQKPVAQVEIKPASTESKPVTNFGNTAVNISFNAIQSSSYGGMDIMPGMTIPVSHFGNLDNDTIQPNQKALEALKLQARLLAAQISSAEQELLKSNQTENSATAPIADGAKAPIIDGDEAALQQQQAKPSVVPQGDGTKAPITDGNEAVLQQQQAKPSVVPQGDGAKAPITDGDEAVLQQQQAKPSVVPQGDGAKAPITDSDEAALQQQQAKPSVVPQGDGAKAPITDGDEAALQQQQLKPTIVPQGDGAKAPITDGDEAVLQQQQVKPSVIPQGDGAKAPILDGDETALQQQQAKPSVIPNEEVIVESDDTTVVNKPVKEGEVGAGAQSSITTSMPSVEANHSQGGKGNLYTKLYGAMQQGHYDEANIQQPTVADKSANNTLGFNSELAKPITTGTDAVTASNVSEIAIDDGDVDKVIANTSNSKEVSKRDSAQADIPVVSKDEAQGKSATHTSATDVAKTKEFLAQRAHEAQKQQEVLKDKQVTKEAVAQENQEQEQDKKAQTEQVVQEEFVATMQARAQKADIALEQAQLRNGQTPNIAQGQGQFDEDGAPINQFSRLYQSSLSEQKAEQARVLGSSQVNTVGDTNIKATGATIASNTTNNTEEATQNATQNQVNLNKNQTVGTTNVEQANRLLGAGETSSTQSNTTGATLAQGTNANTSTSGPAQSTSQATTVQSQLNIQAQASVSSTTNTSSQSTHNQAPTPTPQVQINPNSNPTPSVAINVNNMNAKTSAADQDAQALSGVSGTSNLASVNANKGVMSMPNNMSSPVINLDEDSLQDEIIKNVMQTVPSDDLDEFNLKNNALGNQALSGVIADTDLTEDNNSFNQILTKSHGMPNLSDSATILPTTSAVGASQITSGQNAPIPEESIVNNINTPKEGGFFRRLASLFSRKEVETEVVASDKIVDPSKAALEQNLSSSESLAKTQESATALANMRSNSLDALVNRLQSAASDQALPPKMQEQAQNLIKALQNPVHDLKTVSSWLNFVTGPMSPSSSQAMALHQWAFMLLCIRFEQIGKNVDKFLKKTANGNQKLASLETTIKEHAKLNKELDEVSVSKSHELLKETFGQVERMQQQMQSIPQDQSLLRYIPLPPNYQGGKEGSFSAQKRQDEDGGTSWHLNFNLDLEDLGGLQVKVKLRFPEVQMSFVAEKFETLQKVQAHMPELNARLKEIGLTSKGSNARLGPVHFNHMGTSENKSKFKFEGNAFNVDA